MPLIYIELGRPRDFIKGGLNLVIGMLLIYNQLKAELDKKGLKEIENPIGKELDTDFHEAITNIPAQDKKQKGKIVDVIEKGYLLSTKVLRYAKVVVAN